MSRMIRRLPPVPYTLAGLGVAALAFALLALANSDAWLEGAFRRGLARAFPRDGAAGQGALSIASRTPSPVGSEDDWLRGLQPDPNLVPVAGQALVKPLGRPLVVGDEVTIAQGGKEHVFVISDVRELPAAALLQNAAGHSRRYLLITCQETAAGVNAVPLRLVVEAVALPFSSRPPHLL